MPVRGLPSQAASAVGSAGAVQFGRALGIGPTVQFSPSIGILIGRLDKLGVDIRSFRVPLHDAVQQVMIPSIRRNFEEESARSGPIGVPWEPLSDFSLTMRDRGLVRFHEGGARGTSILDATGKLKRKATQLNLWTIDNTKAEVRDIPQSVWYGKVHQSGYPSGVAQAARVAAKGGATAGSIGAGLRELVSVGRPLKQGREAPVVPARPFLVVQPEDEEKVKAVFVAWLTMRVETFYRW